ncbi:hypothetical protein PR048_027367 [Dryococelus australis]|uniref:Uncharacterized protein n=1 Tax=Dryococelus australis TaxID=614101 RepID=A0ABQ9GGG7_9NEOP|nr:hypothetical protein PR048_027367 [Dryococelus australis]
MATTKFKDPSPYLLPALKPHHTDQLILRFMDDLDLRKDHKGSGKPVNVALFGLGRAGTFHLPNLAYNPRVKLLYICDDVEERMFACRKYWNLEHTRCVSTDKSDQIFEDPE